jgi:large subunit ribosomal protein L35
MKPNKSMLSRFKVTKKGKVKRHHAKTSHLMSARTSKTRRHLRKGAILSETLAGNVRLAMGLGGKNPNRVAHEERVRAAQAAKAEAQPAK